MPNNPTTILFTSAGRRVELIRAFRRAAERLGLDLIIVASDVSPLAPALQAADRQYLVPPVGSHDYVTTLAGICATERVRLVFPLIDPDIPVLASARSALERTGVEVAVVSPRAARIASDKWSTRQLFQSLGLPVAGAWLPTDMAGAQRSFPLFIKPRAGSAGKNAFRVRSNDELEFFIRYVEDPIIEECLPGPEITCDVLCDLGGELLGITCRQRIEVRGGEVSKGVTIRAPEVVDACARIAHALPAVGPITVQCMMRDGAPHFTEINARFGGGVPLGIAAGLDAPALLLARAAGLRLDPPPLGEYQIGLYTTRYDDAFFLSDSDVANVASRSI